MCRIRKGGGGQVVLFYIPGSTSLTDWPDVSHNKTFPMNRAVNRRVCYVTHVLVLPTFEHG